VPPEGAGVSEGHLGGGGHPGGPAAGAHRGGEGAPQGLAGQDD